MLDACLAEGSRLRRDVPEEKREELFFLIPKVDTLFVPKELHEFPGHREPSRSLSVRGSTAQPQGLHESIVMVARERDQGGVALRGGPRPGVSGGPLCPRLAFPRGQPRHRYSRCYGPPVSRTTPLPSRTPDRALPRKSDRRGLFFRQQQALSPTSRRRQATVSFLNENYTFATPAGAQEAPARWCQRWPRRWRCRSRRCIVGVGGTAG